jgi:phosphatidylethanolamine N-methyltransferase
MSDIIVLSIIATHFLFFWYLPSSVRVPTLCAIFLFWRLSYNVGIGYLLDIQSKKRRLITWAQKSGIFDESKNPIVYNLIKKEITAKVTSEDYDFDKAPIEFNTWLVFRRLVDLILMCDFVSYSLFAFSCYSLPEGENSVLTMARWVGGLILIVFNLWVKLDAHRVVKDYAWCSSSPGSRTIFSGC